MAQTLGQAERMGAPRAKALCYYFEGAIDFQAGHWKAAEASIRRAVGLYHDIGSASGEALALQRLGVLLTARGEFEEARKALSEGLVIAERAAMRSHCLTRLQASMIRNRLAAQDAEGLAISLADGLEAARRHGHCVTCNALLLPEVVRARIVRGELDEAAQSAQQLAETASEFKSRAWTAMGAHAEARVLMAREQYADAITLFERAGKAFLEVEQPYDAARCIRSQAACLRAGAKKKKADELERRATELFESVGAPGVES